MWLGISQRMQLSRYMNMGQLNTRGLVAAQTLRDIRKKIGDQARNGGQELHNLRCWLILFFCVKITEVFLTI